MSPVPADAPPMFVAAATDDSLGLAPQSVASTRSGRTPTNPPNSTCTPKAATASACTNKTSLRITGSTVRRLAGVTRLAEEVTTNTWWRSLLTTSR